jgi:hypothetical protein
MPRKSECVPWEVIRLGKSGMLLGVVYAATEAEALELAIIDFRIRRPELVRLENLANKIGRMAPDGSLVGEYDIQTPASGARCITAMSDGRLFFTQYDAGLISEIAPQD